MVWRYGLEGATHKIWSGSMQQFPRNLSLRTADGRRTDDGRTTDGRKDHGRLRHDSSSAEKVKQS